jgi:hypothetical protein
MGKKSSEAKKWLDSTTQEEAWADSTTLATFVDFVLFANF